MWSMRSAAVVALVVWVLVLLYLSHSLFTLQGRGDTYVESSGISTRLDEALSSIQELKKQNVQLKDLIEAERREHKEIETQRRREGEQEKRKDNFERKEVVAAPVIVNSNVSSGFSLEHEQSRRGLDQKIWEIFYLLKSQFSLHKGTSFEQHTINQLYSLLAYSQKFADQGQDWRRKSLTDLTRKIQEKVNQIQNPKDCAKAKILVCNLDKQCGFGCQLHHVGYCFVTAFGEERTMILHNDGQPWRYSKKGWTGAFLPVSTCTYSAAVGSDTAVNYRKDSPSRVVELPIVDALQDRPIHLPLSFPVQLKEEMLKLHSNPPVYFISQFLWYLMRSNTILQEALDKAAAKIPFGKSPIVGLQVRRTDKIGTEAAFHSVEEYMDWTEVWFRVQDVRVGKKVPRKVYIASDDPTVVPEARKKYPDYEVFGDVEIASGAKLFSRYTDASLFGVITDIRLLSQCDYLVCTFSSQVCRMGFELMQVRIGDAGESFHSLDDLYYYGGQHDHEQTVVEAHKAERAEEIDLSIGDTVGVAGNHWDGYSMGTNRRTGKHGLYPSYKVEEKWRSVDFPAFNN